MVSWVGVRVYLVPVISAVGSCLLVVVPLFAAWAVLKRKPKPEISASIPVVQV